jgi:putative ABC transport system substrate-binding protein
MVKESDGKRVVVINQFVSHPALDKAREGVEAALKEYKPKLNIQVQNAQGNIAIAAQIASHQAAQHPDVMVSIATPSAQANLKARKNKNVLLAFTAVTDPVAAGLTEKNNVIGVSDTPPIEELIELLTRLMPERKRVGVIFNPGEINSVKMIEKFSYIAQAKGLNIITSPVNSSSNIKVSVQKLIDKVDVIYLPQDNLVVSAIDNIVKIGSLHQIPIIGNDPSLVDKGLLFALGSDYFKNGKQLGEMIVAALEGKLTEPKIQPSNVKEYKVNEKVAVALNINIKQLKGGS